MHLTANVCPLFSISGGKFEFKIFLDVDGRARTGKWVLFILPLITVLREGLSPFFIKTKATTDLAFAL